MQVVDSAKAITTALNMYGASAKDAARYTNVLGAGAKEGAAEVLSQTESILKSGVAAARAKIPIEQLVGSIQALADKGIKDEIAGTGLKTFFIKLQSGAKETNPAIVGLQKALENLNAQNLSSAEIQQRFGLETFTVAAAMIDSAKKVDYYTKAVTGTSVALEQAQINSKTTAAKLAQSQEAFSIAGQELVKNLNPALLGLTNITTQVLKLFAKYPGVLLALAAAFAVVSIAYARNAIAATAQTALLRTQAMWTDVLNSKTLAFFKTLAKNPYTYIIAGAIAGIAWLNSYLNKQQEVNTEQQKFIDLANKSKNILNDSKSLEDRMKVVNALSTEQLQNLKSDVEQQKTILGNFDAEMVTRLKKIYDEDVKLTNLKKDLANAKTGIEKAWAARQIEIREDEIVSSLSSEYNRNQKSIAQMTKYLTTINKLLSVKPKNNDTKTEPTKGDTPYEKEVKAREKLYKEDQAFNKAMYSQNLIDQDEYEIESTKDHLEYLRDKLLIQKKYKEDTTETEIQISDVIISVNQKAEVKLLAAQKEAENAKKKTDEEALKEEKEFQAKRKSLLEKYGIGDNSIIRQYKNELAELKKSLKDKLITQKEYEEAVRKLKLKTAGQYLQQSAEIAQQGSNLVSALQEAETLAVDNKYAAQLKAAKKAGKDTTALEEKIEQEKKDVKKKYADISFAISVAQIITNTALAITKALAEMGPIAGPIFAGIVGATGLAEIAVANQQREAVKNLWTGGYTGNGGKYEPRGIVHAGEFVANQDAVGNGALRRVFNLVDHAQRTNTVARITGGDVARAAGSSAPSGAASAGSSAAQAASAQAMDVATNNAVLAETRAAIAELTTEIRKGITAYSVISGNEGVVKRTEQYNRLLLNKSRG